MIKRLFCFYFLLCALVASVILVNQAPGKPALEIALYIFLYPFACSLAAYYFWQHRAIAYVLGLLPSLSQVFRPIGDWAWLSLPPPISLGIPMGDFSAGRGFVLDFLAAALVIVLLYGLFNHRHSRAASNKQ